MQGYPALWGGGWSAWRNCRSRKRRRTVEAEANLEWKEALRGLDEKYRLIVVLFYAEGLRTAEIGKLLQLPDSTVRTRLARGREQLAKYYAETEEGGGRK